MHEPPPKPAAALCALMALLFAALAAGCAGDGRDAQRRAMSYAEPAVVGAEAGLEVQVWIVEDDALGFAYALADHEQRARGVPDGVASVWRANGIRIVPVPLNELDSLRATFRRAGLSERRWHGLAGQWTPVVEGPRLGGRTALALDSGILSLNRGRLRLLGRCWLAPDLQQEPEHEDDPFVRAVMRIELLPQHAEQRRRSELDAVLNPDQRPPEDEGLLFRRFLAELPARKGQAYLLVPEDPRTDWATMLKEDADDAEDTTDVGPLDPGLPTLGEAMLTSRVAPEDAPTRRMVVVLLPRVPDRFELLSESHADHTTMTSQGLTDEDRSAALLNGRRLRSLGAR